MEILRSRSRFVRPFGRAVRPAILIALAAAAPAVAARAGESPAVREVSVSAFTGLDRQLAAAVSESVLTDLARSASLTVFDLREPSPGPAGPRARYKVVGSCISLDGSVSLSARVMDRRTGGTLPGGACRVTGPREKAFMLAEELAARLTSRLTDGLGVAPAARQAAEETLTPAGGGATILTAPLIGAVDRETPVRRSRDMDEDYVPQGRSVRPNRGRFSGLVIDARGHGLDRSMSPRIRREDGSVVWAGAEASPDFVIDKGIVVYARSMSEAERMDRAGDNPLVLRAIARYRDNFRSDPVLADADAEELLHSARKDGFLKKFNVVFIVD